MTQLCKPQPPREIRHVAGSGDYSDKFYCGRKIGRAKLVGSDGRCGPTGGPQCADCIAYTHAVESGAVKHADKATAGSSAPMNTSGTATTSSVTAVGIGAGKDVYADFTSTTVSLSPEHANGGVGHHHHHPHSPRITDLQRLCVQLLQVLVLGLEMKAGATS